MHPIPRPRVLSLVTSRNLLLALGCAAFLGLGSAARAADGSPITDPAIESICRELEDSGLLNGVVLVADSDTIIHRKSYGLASVEHGLAHTLDTRFMVASVTKAFTACAVLQTVEQGKLDLRKPVDNYLAELKGTPAGALTAHELLSHSGGLPGFVEDQTEAYSREQFLTGLKAAELNPARKGRFDYQNENFMLLALLLERIHGADYATILQQQVFTPLHMKDGGVNLGGPVIDRLATGYVKKDGAFLYPPLNNLGQTLGAGCIYATAPDLLKFLRALEQGQVLQPDTLNLIREPKAGPYSYGWFTRQVGGKPLIAAFGRMPGYSSLIALDGNGRSFVVLNNIYDCPVTPLLQRLVGLSASRP